MKIGLVGLGRMGTGIAERLRRSGHEVVGYDQNPAISQVKSLGSWSRRCPNRTSSGSWCRPADATQATVDELAEMMTGRRHHDRWRQLLLQRQHARAAVLKQKGISFMDVGTSGGVWGLKEGFSLMVGGEKAAYDTIEPLLKALAPTPETGYGYMGPSGAGHFVKMVHNGIEYGLMQAYAEGFELMEAKKRVQPRPPQHRRGLAHRQRRALLAPRPRRQRPRRRPEAREARGLRRRLGRGPVDRPGVDRPGCAGAGDHGIALRPIPLRQTEPFGPRLLAALRNQFGGHAVKER